MTTAAGEDDICFREAFNRRAARDFALRATEPQDRPFLFELFVAVQVEARRRMGASDGSELGPLWMLQFETQQASYASAYPHAAKYVVARRQTGALVAQMMIDWSCVPVHTIDLAVLPSARVGAAGLHLMRAWLETCDRMQVAASLNVMPDNPSRRLYGFLGFEETEPLAFPLPMLRRPRTRARADRADSDSITAEHVDL